MTTELYRGIKKASYIVHGFVTDEAFPFSDSANGAGYKEESVNWNDDVGALPQIRERHEFEGGIGIINIPYMEIVLKAYIQDGYFSYNHNPDPQNPQNIYHGNVCIRDGLETQLKKQIRNVLANLIQKNIIEP